MIDQAIEYSKLAYDEYTISYFNCQALVIDEGDGCVISIRGTEVKKIVDVVYDLHAFPWPTSYGWAHRGFLKMAKGIAKEIKRNLNGRRIKYITGHSMGGSVAQLLGWIFHVDVISIGAPLCFRALRKLPFKLTLLKNGPDPITRINFWFYKEYGTVIQMGACAACISKNKDVHVLHLMQQLKQFHPIVEYEKAYDAYTT